MHSVITQALATLRRDHIIRALVVVLCGAPLLVFAIWYVIRPEARIDLAAEGNPPVLARFYGVERSEIGVYRWSGPGATITLPGYALPGVLTFTGVSAPDGAQVTLRFPGQARMALPINQGSVPLRHYRILWPARADALGRAVVTIDARLPETRIERRPLALLLTEAALMPLHGSVGFPWLLPGMLSICQALLFRSLKRAGLAFAPTAIAVAVLGIGLACAFLLVPAVAEPLLIVVVGASAALVCASYIMARATARRARRPDRRRGASDAKHRSSVGE